MVVLENGLSSYRQNEPFGSRYNGAAGSSIVQLKGRDARSGNDVQRPPLFSGILPGDYTRITAAARVREFARGEVMFIEGDSVQQVLLLTSGLVKLTQIGMSGMEVILRFSASGDVLGAEGMCSTGSHRTSAQASRLCRALVWEAPAFKALVERYPVLHQNMARILGAELMELQQRFREVATERVGPRVARQLVRLLEKIGQPVKGVVEIGLSREELAQMTGTTLFTVSRLLSAWGALGLVRPRREAVTICNIPALLAMAE